MTPEEREQAKKWLNEEHNVRTICNVIRHIRSLCEEAIWMAKQMDRKLREYKKDWDEKEWDRESST